jgi:DnaJ-class molecular chaperone
VLTLRAMGHASADGGDSGDLRVTIDLVQKPSDAFIVSGDDLLYTHAITLEQALLGFNTTLRHLDGRAVHITRNAITVPGHRQAILHQGLRRANTPALGDLVITYFVEFPRELSASQRAHLSAALSPASLDGSL